MGWGEGYVAIDWGTTNRRLYAVDGHHNCLHSLEDDRGILSMEPDGFGAEIDDIRHRFGNRPMLLAGMVGSDRGWRHVAYAASPAGLTEIAGAIEWIEPERLGIVPGVSQTSPHVDAMRGEEIQALGAVAAGHASSNGLICLPGTHTKWITMAAGCIAGFQTTMTGEIFALLTRHSILAPQLTGPVKPDASFCDGVVSALSGSEPLSTLFTIRARHVLGEKRPGGAGYASGLLIGSDVRSALGTAPRGSVHIVGRPELCALYRKAIMLAGREAFEIDGAKAFLAGSRALVEQIS